VGKKNKSEQAKILGISRQLPYYQHKKPPKDWELKTKIEEVLREHPSYGHKRLAIHLKINKKRILRVMKIFGIKPYRKSQLETSGCVVRFAVLINKLQFLNC